MIKSLRNLRDIGQDLALDHGIEFVQRNKISNYVKNLRESIKKKSLLLNSVPQQDKAGKRNQTTPPQPL